MSHSSRNDEGDAAVPVNFQLQRILRFPKMTMAITVKLNDTFQSVARILRFPKAEQAPLRGAQAGVSIRRTDSPLPKGRGGAAAGRSGRRFNPSHGFFASQTTHNARHVEWREMKVSIRRTDSSLPKG